MSADRILIAYWIIREGFLTIRLWYLHLELLKEYYISVVSAVGLRDTTHSTHPCWVRERPYHTHTRPRGCRKYPATNALTSMVCAAFFSNSMCWMLLNVQYSLYLSLYIILKHPGIRGGDYIWWSNLAPDPHSFTFCLGSGSIPITITSVPSDVGTTLVRHWVDVSCLVGTDVIVIWLNPLPWQNLNQHNLPPPKEVMVLVALVCLFVCLPVIVIRITYKIINGFAWNFSQMCVSCQGAIC